MSTLALGTFPNLTQIGMATLPFLATAHATRITIKKPPHRIEVQLGAQPVIAADKATFRANPRVILAFHLALEP